MHRLHPLKSLLLKVVLIRVATETGFQESVAWHVQIYPNLTFYPLGWLGQGLGYPFPLPGQPRQHRPPQLEQVVAGT